MRNPADPLSMSFGGNRIAGDGWPADREHHRVLFGVPRVIDTVEHHVVALLGQKHTAFWQLYPELSADQQEQGGALLASGLVSR